MERLRQRLRGLARNSASNEYRFGIPTTYGVATLGDIVSKRASVLAVVLLVAACGGGTSTTSTDRACPPSDSADMVEITTERAELLLGYFEADAERCAAELGWGYRVGMRDGESFAVTEDFSLSRVTVTVDDDVVTAIIVG